MIKDGNTHDFTPTYARLETLEAQLLELQVQCGNNVVTWEHEKRIYEQMVFDLQKRVDALEKAPEKRNEEFSKLWKWVQALEQRLIRVERHEQPAKSRQPA